MIDKKMNRDLKKAIRVLKRTQREHKRKDQKWLEIQEHINRLKSRIEEVDNNITDKVHLDLINKVNEFYIANNRKTINGMWIHKPEGVNFSSFSLEDIEYHWLSLNGKVKSKADYYKLKGVTPPEKKVITTDSVRRIR